MDHYNKYWIFQPKFPTKLFRQISNENFVGKHLEVKAQGPHAERRWNQIAWQLVVGWSYRGNFRRKTRGPHAQRGVVVTGAGCVYINTSALILTQSTNSKSFPSHFLHLILTQIFINITQILFFIIYTILHHFIIIVEVSNKGNY